MANYRPNGPIKFNVQRAQQVQQDMGMPATSPIDYGPTINGYSPPVNGYATQNTGYPWPVNVTRQNPPSNIVQYDSYY